MNIQGIINRHDSVQLGCCIASELETKAWSLLYCWTFRMRISFVAGAEYNGDSCTKAKQTGSLCICTSSLAVQKQVFAPWATLANVRIRCTDAPGLQLASSACPTCRRYPVSWRPGRAAAAGDQCTTCAQIRLQLMARAQQGCATNVPVCI